MASFSVTDVFKEARRRRVFRLAGIYIVGAWVFVQFALATFPAFGIPDTAIRYVWIGVAIGLPIAVFLGWRYDIRSGRIVRTVSSNAGPDLSVSKIDIAILGALSIVVVIVISGLFGEVTNTRAPVESDRLLPQINPNSIAVLPFANASAAEEDAEFFAVGMHDELLTRLADITALKVISRTSVMEYRDTTKNMRQIGKELGVVYLLEGRVQRAGDRLHIIIQLIDAASDEHVWQDTYDRELTAENIFALQAEMATSIATELHQTLSPEMTAKLNEQLTQNTRAYEFYLSGEVYLKRLQADVAIRQFGRAVEEDPMFAVAWAALSRAHTRAYWEGLDRIDGQHLEKAREAAARAFELVPDLPEAHFAMGYFYMYVTREHEKSLTALSLAARDMPGSSDVRHTIAEVQRRTGDIEASIATTARAIELDPRNTTLLLQQAASYAYIHDAAQFHRHLDRVLEIEPDSIAVTAYRLRFGLMLGDALAALRLLATDEESRMRIEGSGWAWSRYVVMLGFHERDYDAVTRTVDEFLVGALSTYARAAIYARVYQVTRIWQSRSSRRQKSNTNSEPRIRIGRIRSPACSCERRRRRQDWVTSTKPGALPKNQWH